MNSQAPFLVLFVLFCGMTGCDQTNKICKICFNLLNFSPQETKKTTIKDGSMPSFVLLYAYGILCIDF